METENLIKALQSDMGHTPMAMGRAWLAGLMAAVLLAALVFFLTIGMRPDIGSASQTIRFLFKFVVTLLLAATALRVASLAARPDISLRTAMPWLAAAPLALGAAIVLELANVPSTAWRELWLGDNRFVCLTYIPLIGIVPLAIFLAVMRHGAPTRPAAAGAVAGVLAGAVAATFYAAHCTDDSPLFVATWYSLAIAILASIGALVAPRVLRW